MTGIRVTFCESAAYLPRGAYGSPDSKFESGCPVLPEYKTEGSSGLDLRAAIPAAVVLKPMERTLVPTGIAVEIPAGLEGQVRPRSGLALEHGITCLNTPGTIDSDYRGEIKVICVNLSSERFVIEPGMRIAQLVFARIERIYWELSETIGDTARGAGGFGHSGKH